MNTRPLCFLVALGASSPLVTGCGGDSGGAGGAGGAATSTGTTSSSSASSSGTGGAAPGPCQDKMQDGTETDVDCGGTCARCDDGKKCSIGSDCASTACTAGLCAQPTCVDGTRNGKETDVDCGTTCSPCADGKGCAYGTDCASGVCTAGVCQASKCNDSVMNGTETSVDCGGSCPHCPDGQPCVTGADCASTICDASVCASNVTWADRAGDTADQTAFGVAVDAQGNVLVTGSFHGVIDWGGGPLVSAGGADIFLVKLDPMGKQIWAKRFGDTSDQAAAAVAVNAAGQIWITGSITGNVDFGGGVLASADPLSDAFLASFGPGGAYVSAARYGGAANQRGTALAVGSSGHLFLGGVFDGALNLGCGPLTGAGSGDIFVAHLDANAGCLFAKSYGDASAQELLSIAPDPANNVLIGGRFKGTVSFGGPAVAMPATTFGAFTAKLDGGGNHLFSTAFGNTTASQQVDSVATDASGNVFVAGSFSGTLTAGATTVTSVGANDLFVLKLDPAGTAVWAARFGDATDQLGAIHLATDPAGNVLLAGTLQGTIDLGGALTSAGANDAFLAKLDGAGNPLWSLRLGDAAAQQVHAVAISSATKIAVVGGFAGAPVFGATTLMSAGGEDAFAAVVQTP
jgi:hypothetical protein